ncbi:MAG: FapA family protein [Spirochaetaceae bacterium]|jgi:uncharacterized protein (DUF342 family)|nr:FapA family protein [Spirochaetaceae bacterium]
MAVVIAKGDASIIINAQETEAKLCFVPNSGGLGWDTDAVCKLAGENHLSPPPSPQTLEPFLRKASKAKEPMELVLYEGVPPENPVSENVVWAELPFPGDILPLKEEVLSQAGGPELYRIKTEKIKRETIVKKPNKLPFLPPKEEVVVVWDKRETREAVEVNPEIKETRYAERDKKLGTISPPKPGKPGKNVFGRPIPPVQQGDSAFLLGRGLLRDKNDIRAEYGGILRIGENWADIIPLAKPSWNIAPGSDGVTLFLKFSPGDPRFPVPTGEEILGSVQGTDAAALVGPGEVDEAIGESVKTGENLIAFPLFKTQEADARVVISPDQTKAELRLRKGLAGARSLDMRTISQAIKDSKVQGFDLEKLKAALQDFMGGKTVELTYPLVEGKPSTRGKDKEIKILAPLLPEGEKAALLERLKNLPQSAGPEVFPLAEAAGAAIVKKGDRIAQIEKSPGGEPGQDVFGNVLPGLPGNDPELKLFQGLRQHGLDILAGQDGLLLIGGSGKNFQGGIIDYRDAAVTVHISEDAMEASADLVRETGAGNPLKQETILKALADAGVSRGIDPRAAEAALRLVQSKGNCTAQVLARGEPPVAQGASPVTWLVPVTSAKGRGLSVAKGTALVDIGGEIAEGREGFDVTGKVLESGEAAALTLEHDGSIIENPIQGGKRLTAAYAGELNFDGKTLKISTIQGIKGDVGQATGNISFSGEVRITGKVSPGFTVMGGGNVLIAGSAESALVSAGGKVMIAQGVIGGGRGVVRARTTIEASFVEQATLMAVEDIRVKTSCSLCNIKTNGKLLIAGEAGKLVGGVCKARLGVIAANIGSEQGNQTEISFGQDYLVRDQIEAAEREIEKIKAELLRIEKNLKQAEQNPASLNALRAEKVKFMKTMEQAKLKVFTLREKFEEHFESEIRVRGLIYPGVVMESHDRYYEIIQKRSQVIFFFDRESGRIKERMYVANNTVSGMA